MIMCLFLSDLIDITIVFFFIKHIFYSPLPYFSFLLKANKIIFIDNCSHVCHVCEFWMSTAVIYIFINVVNVECGRMW